jgi:hypothetical protein
MAVTYVSDLNSLFNTIYDRAIFVAREMNLMANLVDNRSGQGWMTRIVPTRPAVTAVAVNENADFASPTTFGRTNQATLTPIEIISQVVLSDRDMETDPDSAVQDATRELGASIATKIDVDLMGLFDDFSANSLGTAAGTITLSHVAAAVARISAAHATQYGGISAVLHPYHWHDLWVELGKPTTNFVASEIANQALKDYYVATLVGATWYVSSNMGTVASDDAWSGVFAPPAIMLDTRRPARFEQQRDASARAYEMNITAGYAVGIVRDTFGAGIIADATAPS